MRIIVGNQEEEAAQELRPRFLAKLNFAVWALGSAVFVAALAWLTPRSRAVFGELDAELPVVSEYMLDFGNALRSILGLSLAIAFWGLTMLPYFLGANQRRATRFYALLAVLAMGGIGMIYMGLVHPLEVVGQSLFSMPTAR